VPAVLVRMGTPADLPAVGALLAEGFADKFGRIFGPSDRVPAVLAGFTGVRLRSGLAMLFVAEEDGEVVGVLDIALGHERLSDRWEELQIALREIGAVATLRSLIGVTLLLDTNEDASELAYISELAVTASQRRQGIGAALVSHAAAWAQECGKRGLSLHVADGNPAQRFYARMGFQLERRIPARLERWMFDVPAWLYMVWRFPEDPAQG